MDTQLLFADPGAVSTPMLAVFAVDLATGKDAKPQPTLLTASPAIAAAAAPMLASGEFKSALGETLLLHAPAGLAAQRLLLVGLGKTSDLALDKLRKGAGAAIRAAKPRAIREIAIAFPETSAGLNTTLPAALASRAIVEGAQLGDKDYDTYRSDRKDLAVNSLTLIASHSDAPTQQQIRTGFDEGLIVAAAQNFARSLVNEPGNVLTPTVLGARTKAMCDEAGLKCEVSSSEKIQELKMQAFWAVAKGSAEPPALIVMTYEPATATGSPGAPTPVLGLVGKGITFDTGGISIKPAEGMEKMKYDMAGAAAMVGAMHAIARLKPAVKVIAILCSAENMPDGKAFKPGDVVTAMSGTTIEIVNTDAEGRLVLADGLHYARTLGCTHLIDAATLTGACVVALGTLNFGIFSNNESAFEAFMAGLAISGEKGWRLPCTDDYRDHIKSEIADIMNTGKNRYGGAISAAMFLKEFAGETPWVHLDIAGTAWNEEKKPWHAYGPSGVAVRSILEWVRSYSH
jgi:leucyl aminopeptidase